jgi:hypothetical protein
MFVVLQYDFTRAAVIDALSVLCAGACTLLQQSTVRTDEQLLTRLIDEGNNVCNARFERKVDNERRSHLL